MSVLELLLHVGFSPLHRGTRYLCSLITARYLDFDAKLTALRYIVAKEHCVSYAALERDCRYAYEQAVKRRGLNAICDAIGTAWYPADGFVIGEFIYFCALRLKD